MNDYKAVPSGLELSRRIVDCLETTAYAVYQPETRTSVIRVVNDTLQGRTIRTPKEFLSELESYCGARKIAPIKTEIMDFLHQKELLNSPYTKSGDKEYPFKTHEANGQTRKVIGQRIYDCAAREGFPPDFFRKSYFDHVTFYCLPDHADFFRSELHHCKFAVCRIDHAAFVNARIYDSEFYSSILNHAVFCEAILAHTRFRDCELSHVTLETARMKHCSTIDCALDGIDFAEATLDGCTFDRVTVGTIRSLDKAVITQGGATEEECRRNREAIYQALSIEGEVA